MDASILYPFLAAASYHLGARAAITAPLWRTWEGTRFDRFLSCAACSGTWYGMLWALIGYSVDWTFFGAAAWWTIPLVGAVTMITTPILANAQENGIIGLGAAGVSPLPSVDDPDATDA